MARYKVFTVYDYIGRPYSTYTVKLGQDNTEARLLKVQETLDLAALVGHAVREEEHDG